jgi:NADPH-dependent glutamate synthase beta subunit-like oxidoreductase/NAD-dependent dihydropyrimidine dehydrogenase PreA subunit/ferredoxin
MITLDIDGHKVKTEEGKTVLQAALEAQIYIPSICAHPNLSPFGACRLCVVEIKGLRGLPTACTTEAADGMSIKTKTAQINSVRRIAMELMLASHPADCLSCTQNLNCELQAMAQYLGITEERWKKSIKKFPINTANPLFNHDLNKCILCGRCVRACYELRGIGVLSFMKRGKESYIGTALDCSLSDANCKFCGACVQVCPTGAIEDKKGLLEVGASREEMLLPCKYNCPAEIDIPRYLRLIAAKKYSEATAVIREKVPFPLVLGRVCIHPCEEVCRRDEVDEAISIRSLKHFAAERDTGLWKGQAKKAPPTGKRVAIIGSGPAGLTAAYYLTKFGHSVTVFEALPVVGGMMRVGIPGYRLPREVLEKEIDEIKSFGLEIKTETRVESLDELFQKGFHAIFLAIGAHKGIKMGVDGEDAPGVIECTDFLRKVSLGEKVQLGENVAVIGGGNAAIDAARTVLRLKAKKVTIIYRRTRAEMPAAPEEIDGALEEGVEITYLAAPTKIWNSSNTVKLECCRMELGEPDASGRRRPVPIKNSEFVASYSSVIAAIGQMPEIPEGFQVAISRENRFKIDPESCATSREGVFAGGDAVTGPASVIEAIAAGRKGARAIDKYFGGSGILDEELIPVIEANGCLGREEGFVPRSREKVPHTPIKKRVLGFTQVEGSYKEEAAIKESSRCLQCDLRLDISQVELPPKRTSTKTN